MTKEEIKEINNRLKAQELEEERIAKKQFYKNVDSIKKNVQFFFWATMIPMILYVVKFLLDLNP
jgi:hypothetical protein